MAKKVGSIKITKEEMRPRERAPIIPSKKIEDKKTKAARQVKHKRDPRRLAEED